MRRGRLFGRLKLTDARGTLRPMLRPESADDRFQWKANMTPRQRLIWRSGFLAMMVGGFMPQVLVLINVQWRTYPWLTPQVIFTYLAAFAPATVAFLWIFFRLAKNPGIATHRLERGVCGSCCYSIESLPSDPDGCTVCPECGAAWKLPPPPPNNPA